MAGGRRVVRVVSSFLLISVFFFSRGLGAGFGGGGRGVKVLVGVVGGVRVLVCWWRVWVGK